MLILILFHPQDFVREFRFGAQDEQTNPSNCKIVPVRAVPAGRDKMRYWFYLKVLLVGVGFSRWYWLENAGSSGQFRLFLCAVAQWFFPNDIRRDNFLDCRNNIFNKLFRLARCCYFNRLQLLRIRV